MRIAIVFDTLFLLRFFGFRQAKVQNANVADDRPELFTRVFTIGPFALIGPKTGVNAFVSDSSLSLEEFFVAS